MLNSTEYVVLAGLKTELETLRTKVLDSSEDLCLFRAKDYLDNRVRELERKRDDVDS